MENRQDKIDFLTGLNAGKRSLNELHEQRNFYLVPLDDKGTKYQCIDSGRVYTRAELEKTRFRRQCRVVIARCNNNPPINFHRNLVISIVADAATVHALLHLKKG